ncbi:MAG: hypothetical protein RLZZ308_57 [Candidatus Parcubacteria bacterium]|jgi:hypothetical protein
MELHELRRQLIEIEQEYSIALEGFMENILTSLGGSHSPVVKEKMRELYTVTRSQTLQSLRLQGHLLQEPKYPLHLIHSKTT